jgi:hypothetical protein
MTINIAAAAAADDDCDNHDDDDCIGRRKSGSERWSLRHWTGYLQGSDPTSSLSVGKNIKNSVQEEQVPREDKTRRGKLVAG